MSHSTKVVSVPITSEKALEATILKLQNMGINCELLRNATPRMFYQDQLMTQLGQKTNTCPFVLKLNDSPYDVGFVKNEEDGSYAPVFDAWRGHVGRILGCPVEGVEPLAEDAKAVETSGSWGMDDQNPLNLACCISKFLQTYSEEATIEGMTDAGYTLESSETTDDGKIVLRIQT